MNHRFRIVAAATLALALAGVAQAQDRADYNRSVNSVHQPIVSRTDYSFDVTLAGDALAVGEDRRLGTWFDMLDLGYGDTVTVARAGVGARGTPDGIGGVLSRYGMLVSADAAPPSVGAPAPGSARIVVSRAVARVEGCPDWSRGNLAEFDGASQSNYGCAAAQNLAAMIADPQDLVRGAEAHGASDARLSVKAVATWRDAPTTGKAGLTAVKSKGDN
ncbi:CpaD family pilus assembly lipoprotein [Sphingomonas sp.]|uniref:CpaD family pilus assembly lipoprotein n=1 Tax=Sphingomonas sp. TaxID=28214 RepID=UPI003B00D121